MSQSSQLALRVPHSGWNTRAEWSFIVANPERRCMLASINEPFRPSWREKIDELEAPGEEPRGAFAHFCDTKTGDQPQLRKNSPAGHRGRLRHPAAEGRD
jgi:hypothetical protein